MKSALHQAPIYLLRELAALAELHAGDVCRSMERYIRRFGVDPPQLVGRLGSGFDELARTWNGSLPFREALLEAGDLVWDHPDCWPHTHNVINIAATRFMWLEGWRPGNESLDPGPFDDLDIVSPSLFLTAASEIEVNLQQTRAATGRHGPRSESVQSYLRFLARLIACEMLNEQPTKALMQSTELMN